jgi:betaine reductase
MRHELQWSHDGHTLWFAGMVLSVAQATEPERVRSACLAAGVVMVGANRIMPAAGIIHPLGNAEQSSEDDKALRRRLMAKALQALQTEIVRPTIFGEVSDDHTSGRDHA